MSIPQHLRVIGSRSIFRFFLPTEGKPFRSSEFLLVEPANAGAVFRELPGDDSLTVVVDPDDYFPEHTDLLSESTRFWFLRRLAVDLPDTYQEAPGLLLSAREDIQKRASFLKNIKLQGRRSIVVSDGASYELCLALGIRAALSPPPVSEEVFLMGAPNPGRSLGWMTVHDSYSSHFLHAVNSVTGVDLTMADSGLQSLLSVDHSIVVQNPAVSAFPYEAAVSLAAGHTLLATGMRPLWGLEPGIDFLHVSTPEELHYFVKSILRGPSATQLLSFRGLRKAGVFRAEDVFRSLMREESLLGSEAGFSGAEVLR